MKHSVNVGVHKFAIRFVDRRSLALVPDDPERKFSWDMTEHILRIADPGDPFLRSRRLAAAVEALSCYLGETGGA